jgi:hypothetical protein
MGSGKSNPCRAADLSVSLGSPQTFVPAFYGAVLQSHNRDFKFNRKNSGLELVKNYERSCGLIFAGRHIAIRKNQLDSASHSNFGQFFHRWNSAIARLIETDPPEQRQPGQSEATSDEMQAS